MRPLVGIAILLFAAAPAWADEAEDKAVKWAEGLGGKVTRDEKQTDKPVVGVAFNASTITNENIKGIVGFPKLKKLNLTYCEKITDDALKLIKTIKTLEVLSLNTTNVTDEGLEHLEEMTQLKALHLSGCLFVTDKGLESVAKLTELEDLSLPGSIGNAGIKNISGLKKLKKLNLAGSSATDTSMRHIGKMVDLEELYLGNKITDDSTPELAKLKKLKLLNLGGSKFSAKYIDALQIDLPDTTIKP